MTRILALDLGTKTGWAYGAPRGFIECGTVDFGGKEGRFEGGGMRYLKFRRWIAETIRVERITEVVFEEVHRHIGVAAAHAYGGFLGQLTAYCEEVVVPYSSIAVGTIKKFATGNGAAKKDKMIAAAEALGYKVVDDNAADALHLLRCYVAKNNFQKNS